MSTVAGDLALVRVSTRALRMHGLLAVILAVIPVVTIGRLLPAMGMDVAITTALIFAGAAWCLWVGRPPTPPARSRGATGLAVALLVIGGWQLGWIGVEDFWFMRCALPLWAVCWVWLLWGWRGVVWGWRVPAAFGLWALGCDGRFSWDSERVGAWVAARTTEVAGWLLWQGGCAVEVTGIRLKLAHGGVMVGAPCTGWPLATLLWLLLAVAVLLLRLRWITAVLIGSTVAAISFFIGVARVMTLAWVVGDAERFRYWHGAEGGAWFTAAGILALGWLLTQHAPRSSVAAAPNPAAAQPKTLLLAGLSLALGTGLAWTTAKPDIEARPPAWAAPDLPGFQIASDRSGDPTRSGARPSVYRFAWVREISYESPRSGACIDVQLAYVPVLLTGYAPGLPEAPARLGPIGAWNRRSLPAGGDVCAGEDDGRPVWVAIVSPTGAVIARDLDWQAQYRGAFKQSERWLAWLAHRQPMRDKRGYWLAVRWHGPPAGGERTMADAFAVWRGRISCRPTGRVQAAGDFP